MARKQILADHADEVDAIVGDFISRLDVIVKRAIRIVTDNLKDRLRSDREAISQLPANRALLRNIDSQFADALNAEGYAELVEKFATSFNGQFEWFNKVLADITGQLPHPLPPVEFSKADLAQLKLQQLSVKDVLSTVVDKVAARAKQQAVQSMGGLPVKQLTKVLEQTLGTSVAESGNLAETSISTFYRTITDKGFQIIEKDLPGFAIRYNYEGPLDKITRPFCTKLEKLSRGGKTWSRKEINRMSNGQLPNVFTTGGGFRCRHQWVISVSDLRSEMDAKGAPKKAEKRAPTHESVRADVNASRALHSARNKGKLPAASQLARLEQIRLTVASKLAAKRGGANV